MSVPRRFPSGPLRVLLAAAFAGLGLVFVWGFFSWASPDLHAGRIAAVVAPLLVGGLVAFRPGRPAWLARFAVLSVASVLAVGGWLFVPAPGGLSLADAVEVETSVSRPLARPYNPERPAIRPAEAKARIDSLAADYPDMAANLARRAESWAERAARVLADNFDKLPAEDATTGVELTAQAQELGAAFPGKSTSITVKAEAWAKRAAEVHAAKLGRVPAWDAAGFAADAEARAALTQAFPATRGQLLAAEDAWAVRTAENVRSSVSPRDFPQIARDQVARCREWLPTVRGLDPGPARFAPARRVLLDLAMEIAREEVRRHADAARYDAAYGTVAALSVEWLDEARAIGAEAELDRFREGYKDLKERAEKAGGDPDDVAPVPRERKK